MKRKIFAALTGLFFMTSIVLLSGGSLGNSGNPVAVIETNKGTIRVELYESDAPATVENFIKYAEDGFYDGLLFHRVIEGFMIQGGGFRPGMEYVEPTYSQITNEAASSGNRNTRGTIAMARTQDPHSATSQFFINHADNGFLDWDQSQDGWGYCVFGRVISGINVVDDIASVQTTSVGGQDDVPVEDVIINRVTIDRSPADNGEPGEDPTIPDDTEDESSPFYTSPLFIQMVIGIVAAAVIIGLMYIREKGQDDDSCK